MSLENRLDRIILDLKDLKEDCKSFDSDEQLDEIIKSLEEMWSIR